MPAATALAVLQDFDHAGWFHKEPLDLSKLIQDLRVIG
jgi:hypothetical protein